MTIVTCTYRPKRARKAKRTIDFPLGRIVTVSVKPTKKRHPGDFDGPAPDDAERSRRVAAFLARTLERD